MLFYINTVYLLQYLMSLIKNWVTRKKVNGNRRNLQAQQLNQKNPRFSALLAVRGFLSYELIGITTHLLKSRALEGDHLLPVWSDALRRNKLHIQRCC
ncbi:MAG: hypothetical protein BACD_02598 [Bacteroides rodentium]